MLLPVLFWALSISSTVAMSLPSNPQAQHQHAMKPSDSMSADSVRLPVPGDSTVFYNGDPSDDILCIDTLDLVPNPPIELPLTQATRHFSHMALRLIGTLTSSIGSDPQIKITASLEGTVGPSVETKLCANSRLEITQNGSPASCPPEKGPVEMSYSVIIPYTWLKKGNYTVRAEMYATGGARITDFEGTVWVDGRDGDGDGWE